MSIRRYPIRPGGGPFTDANTDTTGAQVGGVTTVSRLGADGKPSAYVIRRPPRRNFEAGPASALVTCTDQQFPPSTDLTGWTGQAASSSDVDGAHIRMTEAADVVSPRFAVTPGKRVVLKLRVAGALPNQVQLSCFTAAGAYVSAAQGYLIASAGGYTPPVAARAVTMSVIVTVPAGATITQAEIVVRKYTGHTANPARIYGWLVADTRTLPALPRYRTPMPFRGLAIDCAGRSGFGWVADATITTQVIRDHFTWLKTTTGLRDGDTLRVFLSLDRGLTRDGDGVPTGFLAQTWTNLAAMLTVAAELRLKVVPVLWRADPDTTTGSFDRTAMTTPAKAAGYQARTAEVTAFLDGFDQVPAIDLINEYAWALSFTPSSGVTYTPQQTAAMYEALSAGARVGTAKPLLASCATGKECVATFLFQDPDSYDVMSLHSYNGATEWHRPTNGKPVVAGEFGPDVSTYDNLPVALAQTVPVMQALPDRVSAGWLWAGYIITHPTVNSQPGTVRNPDLLAAWRAFNPAADPKAAVWPRSLARQEDVDLSTPPVDGAALTYNATALKWGATRLAPRLPAPTPGRYIFPVSQHGSGTSATHGIGVLRTTPWRLQSDLSISRIGAEITTLGEAGSKLRLGIYADDGSGYPGALVLDAGTIAGDGATGVKYIDLGTTTALPAGLYWLAAVVQAVTTTQPTVRTATHQPELSIPVPTALAGQALIGLATDPVTDALPVTFPAGGYGSGSIARLILRAA